MPPIRVAPRAGAVLFVLLALASTLAVVAGAGPSATAQVADRPFECDDTLYLVTGGHTPPTMQLHRVHKRDGSLTPLSDPDLRANALAFNPADGFLYGMEAYTQQLVRVDADGDETVLGVPGGMPANVDTTIAGTILPDGRYLVAVDYDGAADDNQFVEIDLTTRTVVRVLPTRFTNNSIWDLAVSPETGRIYAHQVRRSGNPGRIVEVSHATGALTPITDADPPRYAGSSFFDDDGALWIYGASADDRNQQDTLYRAARPTQAPVPMATGPTVTNSDGASCPYTTVLDKTVSPARTTPGGTVTYTFVLRNRAPVAVTADLGDRLDNGRTFLPGSYQGPGTAVLSDQDRRLDVDDIPVPAATWTPGSGVVDPGETTVTVRVRVAPGTVAPSTLWNQAELTDVSNARSRPPVPSNWPDNDPSGEDPDPTPLEVVPAALDLDKTVETRPGRGTFADTGFAPSQTPVTWRLRVANTSTVDLTDVVVADPGAPGCGRDVGDLAAGTADTWTCTVDAGYAEAFTNRATATGTPVDGGDPVSVADEATVAVGRPAIAVDTRVAARPGSTDYRDDATYRVGEPVEWRIVVTNTGDLDLDDVTLASAAVPACDRSLGALAAGASLTVTCTAPGGHLAPVTNLAVARGTAVLDGEPLGLPAVTAEDPARIDVIAPAVQVRKQVRSAGPGTPFIEADHRDGLAGVQRADRPVEFRIVVTNAGDVDLTDVRITDQRAPSCNQVLGDLAAGASVTVDCTVPGGYTVDTVNQVDVTGTPPLGEDVSATDTAAVDVVTPGILVLKEVAGTEAYGPWGERAVRAAGRPVTYRITVANTGDTQLTGVEVGDPLVPACNRTVGTLAAGAQTTYTCTLPGGLAETLVNRATATGTPPVGDDVVDEDEATVEVHRPELTVDKKVELLPGTGQFVDADHRDLRRGLRGTEPVRFRITVTNTGDTDLADVVVDDDLGTLCDREVGDLAVGQSRTYDCRMPLTGDVVNQAEATGRPVVDELDPVLAVDTAAVESMPEVDLSVDKRLPAGLRAGGEAVWRLVVTNEGPTQAYRDIVVTDELPAGLTYVEARGPVDCTDDAGTVRCVLDAGLAPGQSATFDLVTDVAADVGQEIVNEAVVASLVQEDVDPTNDVDAADAAVRAPRDPGPDPDPADPGDPPPAVDGGGVGALPRTGATVGGLVVLGLALLAVGTLVRRGARRVTPSS